MKQVMMKDAKSARKKKPKERIKYLKPRNQKDPTGKNRAYPTPWCVAPCTRLIASLPCPWISISPKKASLDLGRWARLWCLAIHFPSSATSSHHRPGPSQTRIGLVVFQSSSILFSIKEPTPRGSIRRCVSASSPFTGNPYSIMPTKTAVLRPHPPHLIQSMHTHNVFSISNASRTPSLMAATCASSSRLRGRRGYPP